MMLQPFVTQVQEQLAAASALGDDRTREIAESLAGAASPAVRLALLGAVSAAADEVTRSLLDAPGSPSVGVRLDGDEIAVDVRIDAPAEPPPTIGATGTAASADEGEASARISLRLTEALKAEIDAAARRDGVSVNTWLVRAATTALASPGGQSGPWGGGGPWGQWAQWAAAKHAEKHGPGGGPTGNRNTGGRVTGWIN